MELNAFAQRHAHKFEDVGPCSPRHAPWQCPDGCAKVLAPRTWACNFTNRAVWCIKVIKLWESDGSWIPMPEIIKQNVAFFGGGGYFRWEYVGFRVFGCIFVGYLWLLAFLKLGSWKGELGDFDGTFFERCLVKWLNLRTRVVIDLSQPRSHVTTHLGWANLLAGLYCRGCHLWSTCTGFAKPGEHHLEGLYNYNMIIGQHSMVSDNHVSCNPYLRHVHLLRCFHFTHICFQLY